MARRKRREYPHAIYHVINRGNYRSDVFGTAGAAAAFVKVLAEATKRFGWKLGAYVVMRNHFHLAVQTPEPNLSVGMQWLQVTFAARFNRFRGETGRLFQGRYRAIVLQNTAVWARVADYIHLNPVRAGIVTVDQLPDFRWGSLIRFTKGVRFKGLEPAGWLETLGMSDTPEGWNRYGEHLVRRVSVDPDAGASERQELSTGWAIGSEEWKQQLVSTSSADAHASRATEHLEPRMVREVRWQLRLTEELEMDGHSETEALRARGNAEWKLRIADKLQRSEGASVSWLANALNLGGPATARGYLWRYRNQKLTKHDMTP